MKKPTVEEYEKALLDKKRYNDWLSLEYKNRDKLLDELLNSRETIKLYEEMRDKAKEIVMIYELYQNAEQ